MNVQPYIYIEIDLDYDHWLPIIAQLIDRQRLSWCGTAHVITGPHFVQSIDMSRCRLNWHQRFY